MRCALIPFVASVLLSSLSGVSTYPANSTADLSTSQICPADSQGKINGEHTPLIKAYFTTERAGNEICEEWAVRGASDNGWKQGHCVLVQTNGEYKFWYHAEVSEDCRDQLHRSPCFVDLQCDTGCGWDGVEHQDRCKKMDTGADYDAMPAPYTDIPEDVIRRMKWN